MTTCNAVCSTNCYAGGLTMSQQSSISSNGHVALQPCPDTFPFVSELSLAPLVKFWQQTMHPEHSVEGALAVKVQQALQEAPALLESITDGSVIAQHQEIDSSNAGASCNACCTLTASAP